MSAAAALELYERRMWEHAIRARPRNRVGRWLFKWAWRRRMFPPYPGVTPDRVLLFMRVVELRNERRIERAAHPYPDGLVR